MSKALIRKEYQKIRANISNEQVNTWSDLINQKLSLLSDYKQAQNIGSYYPIKNEVIVNKDPNKNFFYPKLDNKVLSYFSATSEFSINKFGIKEPINSIGIGLEKIDIFFVPLIAFNSKLHRIGYGGGFYDQTFFNFAKNNQKIILIGLGYEVLKTDCNFQSEHDVRLDKIITEKGIYV